MPNNVDRTYITVSELNFYLSDLIQKEELLHNLSVMGEVSGISVKNHNLYCTLKDDGAQIPVCCFGIKRTYLPQNGEKVLIVGTPELYAPYGKLSLIAYTIEPVGKGKLHQELEALKAKLAAEGLFAPEHKKELPPYPLKVAVVTSLAGAVINDIRSTVRRYNGLIDLLVVDVQVQGKTAPREIAEGLRRADGAGQDVVILARGGGSFEDLMPFNSEEVARAIYAMKTPVISAVGHETDVSISDFVADVRALTPTAAAELVAFSTADTARLFTDRLEDAARILAFRLKESRFRMTDAFRRLAHRMEVRFERYRTRVISSTERAGSAMQQAIGGGELRLQKVLATLSARNPAALLQSGYFKAQSAEGMLTRASDFAAGKAFRLYAADGYVDAITTHVGQNDTKQ